MGLNAPTRKLHANERPQLLTHLLALDAEDRRLRFAHALSDDGVRHYVEGIDLSRDAVFVVTDVNLAIIGAAHLAREDGHAQLGMSVLRQSRGQGIGGALLARCAAHARSWSMRVMFAQARSEDRSVRRRRRSVRALAASRPDQSGCGGRRRAPRLIRLRPEILLGGAAGPASAMKDLRKRTSKQNRGPHEADVCLYPCRRPSRRSSGTVGFTAARVPRRH
jgi:GNAT superfamily N-acetyltransferase